PFAARSASGVWPDWGARWPAAQLGLRRFGSPRPSRGAGRPAGLSRLESRHRRPGVEVTGSCSILPSGVLVRGCRYDRFGRPTDARLLDRPSEKFPHPVRPSRRSLLVGLAHHPIRKHAPTLRAVVLPKWDEQVVDDRLLRLHRDMALDSLGPR